MIGHTIVIWLGFCLIAVVIGSAIYAKWINPETEFDHLFNDQIMGSIPRWVWYVVVFGFGGPTLFLLVLGGFLTAPVMMLLTGLAYPIVWLYRRLFHRGIESDNRYC